MEKYLVSLLEQNNRVIVPDLGAFIIRQNEPKDLVFNDLLAFDDGMLTDKLMLEEKILKNEAQSRIRQFVEKARRILETGELFPLENLGFLRMDPSSRIEFLTETNDNEASKDDSDSADQKSTENSENELQDPEPEIPDDIEHSDYEAEYLKLMSAGKKPKKSKSKAKKSKPKEQKTPVPEPEPEIAEPELAEPEPEIIEPEPELAEPEIAEPEPEIPEPELAEPEPEIIEPEQKVKEIIASPKDESIEEPEDSGDDEGFVLDEGDSEVDVDASSEDTPLLPDNEESIFQIEEEDEKAEPEISKDPLEEAVAEKEADTDAEESAISGDEELTTIAGTEIEPETESETEPEIKTEPETDQETEPETDQETEPETEPETDLVAEQEPVDPEQSGIGMSAVDQARAAEEARAIAQERAAMLAARQEKKLEDKPASTYKEPESTNKKVWPKVLGISAVVIFLLAVGWFMFPEQFNSILNRDKSEITPGDDAGNQDENSDTDQDIPVSDQPVLAPDQQPEPEKVPVPAVRPAGKQYHIVAGSFANLNNAEKLVRTLREQGFNASIIGERNNLHTVCFSSHQDKNAAEEELTRVRNSNDPQAWLLYY